MHHELATRLLDLVSKWTKECTTVQDVVKVIVREQLLYTMPASVCVWVHEPKHLDSAEAGQLAYDYAGQDRVGLRASWGQER